MSVVSKSAESRTGQPLSLPVYSIAGLAGVSFRHKHMAAILAEGGRTSSSMFVRKTILVGYIQYDGLAKRLSPSRRYWVRFWTPKCWLRTSPKKACGSRGLV